MQASATSPSVTSDAFLRGCGLPAAWAGSPQWRILDTDFDSGARFLAAWATWHADPQRPRLLHYVALATHPADTQALLSAATLHPDLGPMVDAVCAQIWGLLPGVHRLSFAHGRVLLTLCIGDAQRLLREEHWDVDSVCASSRAQLELSDGPKTLARCCQRGARLITAVTLADTRTALEQAGFAVDAGAFTDARPSMLHAVFDPPWEPRRRTGAAAQPRRVARCAVVGAGIAGASVAASLARRGWQVQVLDAGSGPAAGASGLPVGLFAPHLSPDDNVFSKISRAGVRATLEQCADMLAEGVDWAPSGVLERRPAKKLGLPAGWTHSPGADWSEPADVARLQAAGLPGDSTACWHRRAGWLRPGRLVAGLLATPGVALRINCHVAQLQRLQAHGDGPWQLRGADGTLLAEAELVVLAAGPANNALVQFLGLAPLPLNAVRGQLSWGLQGDGMALPPFPVNGKGALVGQVPGQCGQLAWHAGSTFERGCTELPPDATARRAAHKVNLGNLQLLLPEAAAQLAPRFLDAASDLQAWAGVRCTSPDRLPIVGPLTADSPGVWVSTAMGARGLTRAVLCGELLAARLHGEPLPVEERLARAMGTERLGTGVA